MRPFLNMKRTVSGREKVQALLWIILSAVIVSNAELAQTIVVVIVSVIGMHATGFPLEPALMLVAGV